MRAALACAARGWGTVSPNPAVGAVLVQRGAVLASGLHRRFGGPHAEVDLLRKIGGRTIPNDAVLYLTLEPCVHHGKTPPCTEALLGSGIREFEIAMPDPDPRVRGRGIKALRAAGRRVRVGLLREDAERSLLPFVRWSREGRAAVRVKLAVSADGMLADASGRSKWITAPESRREVGSQRQSVDAVVMGRGTVVEDDPRLDFAAAGDRAPSRIILSRSLQFDPDCRLARNFRKERGGIDEGVEKRIGNWMCGDSAKGKRRWVRRPRLIAATCEPDRRRKAVFLSAGWEIWELPSNEDGIDLASFARRAGSEGLIDLLVEAGPSLAAGFLNHGPVDRIVLYTAPRLLGSGLHWAGRVGPIPLARARRLEMRADPVPGGDLRIELSGPGGGAIVVPRSRRMR